MEQPRYTNQGDWVYEQVKQGIIVQNENLGSEYQVNSIRKNDPTFFNRRLKHAS